jgi:transglutaminase-like putative cysteine protease
MKLRIEHRTNYRYAHPVGLQPHRLMMFPRPDHELNVLESSLRFSPDAQLDWAKDVFGNVVATATFAEPAAELIITNNMTVEQCAPAWPVFQIAPGAHSYPFEYASGDVVDLGGLLQPQHPDDDGRLLRWARAFIYGSPTDTLSLLKDINNGIIGTVAYRTRDEEGTQSPVETLSCASGSCRDIAALFIDAVRRLGFGARAVSGYLYDPDAPAGEGGSTHAWAEVYLPSAGWIAFDPTHAKVGSAGLVPTAVGRCNGQIMPVTGGYLGAPTDFLGMDVRVEVTRLLP